MCHPIIKNFISFHKDTKHISKSIGREFALLLKRHDPLTYYKEANNLNSEAFLKQCLEAYGVPSANMLKINVSELISNHFRNKLTTEIKILKIKLGA